MTRLRFLVAMVALVTLVSTGSAQQGAASGEWRYYGADAGSTKYSPLDQISASTVSRLEIAWRRPHIDASFKTERVSNSFRSTPLMIDGVMYASNGVGLLEAFDPAEGHTIWLQESPDGAGQPVQGFSSRAPAYWKRGRDERLFTVRGAYLYGLNAKTGRAAPGFGTGGRISLSHLGDPNRYYWNSPPVVVRDVVIVGSSSSDNAREQKGRPGDLTAYDVMTGTLRWTFHVIPRDGEFGVETWKDASWKNAGAANVWVPFTADEETGYVYLPTSTPTADWYGGHRRGDNLFAESLVCIDGRTGKRVWHFQLVHHGLWDYDLPAAPVLGDITVEGRRLKAVMQVTKQAFVFAFDRLTGKPVWPIEERAVPASDTPGEEASPTQPFPTRPAPFDRQGIGIDDLIDFTPEMRAEAVAFVKQYRIGPLFTPPSVATETNKGTIALPGWAGGANWGGGAFDPESGVFYIPSVTNPFKLNLVKPDAGNVAYIRGGSGNGEGSDVVGPRGLPIVKPPYGRVTAIDMNRGEHLWMVPNGDGPRDHPLLKPLNLPPLGQAGRAMPLLTRTLLFLGEGDPVIVATPPLAGGRKFRAFDKSTGRVVWETGLPAGLTGAPMTYMHRGRQYVVVPIGGREHPAEFVAFALSGGPVTAGSRQP